MSKHKKDTDNDNMTKDKNEENDEVVVYNVINNDLGLGKGKAVSQGCHSYGKMLRICIANQTDNFKYWSSHSHTTVTLKATEKEMLELIKEYTIADKDKNNGVWCVCIHDAGRTQVAPNSLTALTFAPMKRTDRPDLLKKLKLL